MAVIKLGQLLHRATTAPIDENNPLNVALSGNIAEILGETISSVTPGSTLTLIGTRIPKGVLRTVMVSSGNGTRYSLEIRKYGRTGSTYALESVVDNKAGSNFQDVYDLNLIAPRYSLRFTNTGTIDAYLIWSAVEV